MNLVAATTTTDVAVVAGTLVVVGAFSMILRHTGFTQRWDQDRGLTNSQGAPTPKAFHSALLIGIAGIAVQLSTGSWLGVGLIAAGAVIGLTRYAIYRKTGVYH